MVSTLILVKSSIHHYREIGLFKYNQSFSLEKQIFEVVDEEVITTMKLVTIITLSKLITEDGDSHEN